MDGSIAGEGVCQPMLARVEVGVEVEEKRLVLGNTMDRSFHTGVVLCCVVGRMRVVLAIVNRLRSAPALAEAGV